MEDEAALLAAVNADPDADLPRLVYADWLDDHGEVKRAEFIRVACKVHDKSLDAKKRGQFRAKIKELWRDSVREYFHNQIISLIGNKIESLSFGPLQNRRSNDHLIFRRGFPEELLLSLEGNLETEDVKALLEKWPITMLKVWNIAYLEELLRLDELTKLQDLVIYEQGRIRREDIAVFRDRIVSLICTSKTDSIKKIYIDLSGDVPDAAEQLRAWKNSHPQKPYISLSMGVRNQLRI